MRAVHVTALEGEDRMEVVEIEAPRPGAGEVLLKVHGVGVGYFDALLVTGGYQLVPPVPFVPGSSLSGIVEAVGEGVERVAVGDRVAAFTMVGGLAEYCLLPEHTLHPLPDEVPLDDAANFFVTYATGVLGLCELAKLAPGESVLVLGASGSTGSAAIEIAKACGARVIACASTEEKRQRCLELGADHVVDYTQEGWRRAAKKAAGGQGVDVVWDPVGGDFADPALRCIAPGGRYLVVGFVTGIAKIPLNLPLLKRCSIMGVNWGGEVFADASITHPVMERLIEWAKEGALRTAPDAVVSLEQTKATLDAFLERRSPGKVVIRCGE